jgi:hypothetical protein
MKEYAVLIIIKAFIDLVLPNYTTGAYEVDEADEMGSSGTVRNQYEGTLQTSIRPRVGIRVGKIYTGEGSGQDLCRRWNDRPHEIFFVGR